MEKSLIDIIKQFQQLWKMRELGVPLTEEQQKMLNTYDKITEFSPKELMLNNNTLGLKPSDLAEIINL